MRIRDYPIVADIDGEDLLIVDTSTGTKTIMSKDLILSMADAIGSSKLQSLIDFYQVTSAPGEGFSSGKEHSLYDSFICQMNGDKRHYRVNNRQFYSEFLLSQGLSGNQKNTLFRGYDLGNVITDAQKEAVRNGSFAGLALNDYWIIGGVHIKIIGFNSFKGRYNNPPNIPNHLVLYLITNKFKEVWGDPGSLYINSHVKDVLERSSDGHVYNFVCGLLGEENIIPYKIALPNSQDAAGMGNSYSFYISIMDLPSTAEVGGIGAKTNYERTFIDIVTPTFPLFGLDPYQISANGGGSRWLRDAASLNAAYTVNFSGHIANDRKQTSTHFIQPFFLYSPGQHTWMD